MRKYLVVVWNDADASESETYHALISSFLGRQDGWSMTMRARGIAVMQPTRMPKRSTHVILPDNLGVIIGTLFSTCSTTAYTSIADENIATHAKKIIETSGKELLVEYWGAYVAILHDQNARRVIVVRDPSGKVPCYSYLLGQGSIFFSEMSDLVAFAPNIRLTVDWNRLGAYVHFNEHKIVGTCLNEIKELLAGEALEIGMHSRRQFFIWDPREYWRHNNQIEDFETAVEALRSTAQRCINAWAGEYSSILLNLSGGFDSAVVLGALTRTPNAPPVTCMNRYAHGPGEDERRYARAAANRAGRKPLEYEWTAGGLNFDSALLNPPLTARPTGSLLFLQDTEFRNKIAREVCADIIWTGEGGDHFFLRHTATPSAADFVYDHGIWVGLHKAVRDNALCSDRAYWEVLREAVTLGFSRQPWTLSEKEATTIPLLNKSLNAEGSAFDATHPWLSNARDLPKGKQLQIRGYAELLNRMPALPRNKSVEENHPLISQPLMELCLMIPTYRLLAGGKHRAMAREAFRNYLPEEIRARESKGCTAATVVNLFQRNVVFVRELLLGGALVQQKIIDRRLLESILTADQPMRPEHIFPLLSCMSAELWTRAWSGATLRKAA